MKEFNNYRNNAKAIPLGDLGWQSAEDSGLLNLICKPASHDRIEDQFGHNFVNLGCSSY
ncbi:hypothetical protein COXBURSA331_A0482 [Coxiella burnetii RSA 331]|nr:hypothetical protein COXBURSA331_A0482 [Coxiella burnetii RSA 331]